MICADFRAAASGAGFTVQGHADTAPAGEDILCAAVSSAVYLTANTLTEIYGLTPDLSEHDGYFSLRFSDADAYETAQPLLQGLCLHLLGLEEQYPDYIHIERGAL